MTSGAPARRRGRLTRERVAALDLGGKLGAEFDGGAPLRMLLDVANLNRSLAQHGNRGLADGSR
jgi:hypothetical protein